MYNETKLKILDVKRSMLINNTREIINTVSCDNTEYTVSMRIAKSFLKSTRVDVSLSETQMLLDSLADDLINLDSEIKTMLEKEGDDAQQVGTGKSVSMMDTVTDLS